MSQATQYWFRRYRSGWQYRFWPIHWKGWVATAVLSWGGFLIASPMLFWPQLVEGPRFFLGWSAMAIWLGIGFAIVWSKSAPPESV